jgi:catechol 2,3-dioxygenase-like lactoylglutathione lyase family enzyme
MIDHTGIGVADVVRSAAFYDAALGALGMRRAVQIPENNGTDGVGYGIHQPVFWIDRFTHMVLSRTRPSQLRIEPSRCLSRRRPQGWRFR